MSDLQCPDCSSRDKFTKSGIVQGRQRHKCGRCGYHFSVQKAGKQIDQYYVIKALQLYLEGISYREIERLLGVSHVSVMNWVRKYGVKAPVQTDYHPTYKVLSHAELSTYMEKRENVKGFGMIITEIGDKFMLIKWERFRD